MASLQAISCRFQAALPWQSAAARSGNPTSTSYAPLLPSALASTTCITFRTLLRFTARAAKAPSSRPSVQQGARAAADNEPPADTTAEGLPKPAQNPSGYGLGGPGTWFGFGRRQEREVGRLAMMGFAAALVMEVITGKGVLGQLGVDATAVKGPLLSGLLFLTVAGLVGGWTVIQNPPDVNKAPINEGAGAPRDPSKTFDANTEDPYWTYSRGGIVDRKDGQKGREPFVSDLDDK